ncbi:toprim domain-containing protein [Thiocystis violascens]|uniref:DNA primase/helicase Gp4 N-terminal Bacteriophage T7-like domain-containing protein n=1 Tax=Thiocystis violascens (strain ATCC 17096 / DSM 198 / 6111) TaxID=765911 RepID=I3YC56_THIV6|nr:toprim domain-containing protein [Thiocystis violascens]AFL74574.1 hypothetical protein Thivi_2645 [Thiocystis violascens DSM 198]
MTATTARAPRPSKAAMEFDKRLHMPTPPDPELDDLAPELPPVAAYFEGIAAEVDEGSALAFEGTPEDLAVTARVEERNQRAREPRTCTACGAEFKPPHSAPSAPLCFDCYEARKRALEVLPQTVKGKWLDILPALGVERERLQDEHGPCPGCGGTDLFRFDNRNGSGSWVCGGGGDTQSGDGFDLLSHVHGWSKREAYLAVAEHMGIDTRTPAPEPPTPEELAERKRIADEQARKAAEDLAREQAETARRALSIWTASSPADPNHPYLVKKGVAPTDKLLQIDANDAAILLGYQPQAKGVQLKGPLLVAPIQIDGRPHLSSLELIDGDGRKTALTGQGTKTGGYWAAQYLPDDPGADFTLLIGEGVATALSAKEASGYPVIAALSVSNFPKVISAMRVRFPQARIVLLADLDKGTGEPITAALKAARSFRPPIPLVAPDFGPERPEGATDFNDLHQAQGLDAVRMQIERMVETASPFVFSEGTEGTGGTFSNGAGYSGSPGENPQGTEGTSEGTAKTKPAVDRPGFSIQEGFTGYGKPGLWWHGLKDETDIDQWICSPLYADALAHGERDADYGLLLRFRKCQRARTRVDHAHAHAHAQGIGRGTARGSSPISYSRA